MTRDKSRKVLRIHSSGKIVPGGNSHGRPRIMSSWAESLGSFAAPDVSLLDHIGRRSRVTAAPRPVGMKEFAARLVGSLVHVRAKEIALCLE